MGLILSQPAPCRCDSISAPVGVSPGTGPGNGGSGILRHCGLWRSSPLRQGVTQMHTPGAMQPRGGGSALSHRPRACSASAGSAITSCSLMAVTQGCVLTRSAPWRRCLRQGSCPARTREAAPRPGRGGDGGGEEGDSLSCRGRRVSNRARIRPQES